MRSSLTAWEPRCQAPNVNVNGVHALAGPSPSRPAPSPHVSLAGDSPDPRRYHTVDNIWPPKGASCTDPVPPGALLLLPDSAPCRSHQKLPLWPPESRIDRIPATQPTACQVMDAKGTFSGPDTWFHRQAVLHLLTALSLATNYLYYRYEEL
jgi:hypothetical protein